MRFRVILNEEAQAQLRVLAPIPKRSIRRAIREMRDDPYALDTIPLQRLEILHRVRVGDYRIVFEPGAGPREVNVVRIGHRDWVYDDLERVSGEGQSGA